MNLNTELAYQLKELCGTATKDTSRPQLQTVHIESGPEWTILVTVDGYRLAAIALPIQSEEPFTIHVDAQSLGKLMKQGELDISPAGVNINGIVLPSADMKGYNFPEWRQVMPKFDPKPRANMGEIFSAKYTEDFLKFRLGKTYKSPTYGSPAHSPMIMRYSVYNGNSLGMVSAHAWAWEEDGVHFLYILMPLDIAEYSADTFSVEPDEVDQIRQDWQDGHTRLAELLEERFKESITSVTTEIPWDIWDKK